MRFVKSKEACRVLGLHPNTLRRYADTNKIKTIRSVGGHRLYEVDDFLHNRTDCKVILYCRVSSRKQQDDLQRQIESMQSKYPEAEVIKDIGSGLNFKRKGLQTLLERLLQGDKLKVVVAYRDRLARFGFDLIEFLIRENGGELVVLNSTDDKSPESELTEDLLAILHHFSCRMHGKRSHANKANQGVSESGTAEDHQELVRMVEKCIQQNC